ncbi:MAG: GAF domain-containing protein [Anaerolineae bacterium]|jgi:GAF domain-containing protein|nr:GAF domain-containing protein [Anaerolineae bacterium]
MSAEARSSFSSAYIALHALDSVRQRFATGVAILVLVIPPLLVGLRIAFGEGQTLDFITLLTTGVEVLAGIAGLLLIRSKNFALAGVLISIAILFDFWFTPEPTLRLLLALIACTAAAVLSGTRFFLFTLGVVMVGQALEVYNQYVAADGALSQDTVNTAISTVLIFLTALFFRYFNNLAQSTAGSSSIANQRLDAVAAIGRQTARLLNYDELISTAVNLIKTQFGYYHVQIFLVDDQREFADLVASTGEAGRRLMERRHRLAVGSDSVIGKVTLANEAILVNDTENDPGHAFNPLLPDTRAELALPMQVVVDGQSRVIGALDVQAVEPMAFTASDVQALQALANQMAVSIRNARLFETQASSLKENERLFSEAQSSLDEIQRLNSQLTHQAWEGYLKANPALKGVTATPQSTTHNADWSPLMVQACRQRFPVSGTAEGGAEMVAVPILLRGEILGAMEVEVSPGTTSDLLATMVTIAERMSSALENARLVEEAQAASAQEQRISLMVTRFQEAETVDELLQITLSELTDTLDAEGGSIRIGLTQPSSSS